MSHPSRTVRSLAAGAALAACSFASAGGSLTPLQFSTLQSASGTMTLGSATGSFSYTGPTSYMAQTGPLNEAGHLFYAAYHLSGFSADLFGALIATDYYYYPSGSGSVVFTVQTSASTWFSDLGVFTGMPGSWTVDGFSVSNGDVIGAGVHTFAGSFAYSGAPIDFRSLAFLLYGAAPAVPLPGAAGLAAIGLAGMARRRRR